MGIFDRYAPFVQDFIYEHGWEQLRAIQVAAGEAILDTDDNVLLSASTASGKTEAAFFPILTQLWEDPSHSVAVLYIGPLKALINDQFLRLNDLCEEADIPVWHWHGDVSQSHKNKLLKNPSGILQITPESLEALLLHKHSAVARLFGDLRFVVIDEVHSLLRADRGGQTLCLIERLSRMAGVKPRRIGLSATIGDPQQTGAFLAFGTGRKTLIPKIKDTGKIWRISMEHFYIGMTPQAADFDNSYTSTTADQTSEEIELRPLIHTGSENKKAHVAELEPLEEPTDKAPAMADPGIGYIFEHTRGKKCLIFANSREEAEMTCTTLRQYCEANREADRFLIHHGNLSASYRETAEDIMRDEFQTQSTVTTSTLELGIDIGRLERAFQIDAPFTVSSFLQRMGRTGRRDLPPEMHFVIREDHPEPRAMLPETIPWKLLQGIALIQLYLEERWVEPPRLDRLPYSLLLHQTLASLASEGELAPAELAARILTLSYFHRVSTDDYRLLLKHMLQNNLIEETENGGLIVGLAGERIVNSFKFYAVFQENEEYTVRCESEEIGTIVMPPPPGEKIAIAGHVWIVEEVDHKRHLVHCTRVKGKVPAYFGECPGDINTKVLERMLGILQEDIQYPYLMRNATARLQQTRHSARNAKMDSSPLINLGKDSWCLFPWLGTYAFMAFERILKIKLSKQLGIKGVDSSKPYFINFRMSADPAELLEALLALAADPPDPMELLYPKELPLFEKYDALLPAQLVRKGFAYAVLDLQGACNRILSWSNNKHLKGLTESSATSAHPSINPVGGGLSGVV